MVMMIPGLGMRKLRCGIDVILALTYVAYLGDHGGVEWTGRGAWKSVTYTSVSVPFSDGASGI